MNLHARLHELGLTLPIPAQRSGDLLFLSGQLPVRDGKLIATGRVGSAITLDQAREAARQCALNALAAADRLLEGNWSEFQKVVRAGVFVASEPDFTDQHLVGNGVSELLLEIFGEVGRHARAAIGVPVLPLNASVEVELLLEVREYIGP